VDQGHVRGILQADSPGIWFCDLRHLLIEHAKWRAALRAARRVQSVSYLPHWSQKFEATPGSRPHRTQFSSHTGEVPCRPAAVSRPFKDTFQRLTNYLFQSLFLPLPLVQGTRPALEFTHTDKVDLLCRVKRIYTAAHTSLALGMNGSIPSEFRHTRSRGVRPGPADVEAASRTFPDGAPTAARCIPNKLSPTGTQSFGYCSVKTC
jgi:hypothetical protein